MGEFITKVIAAPIVLGLIWTGLCVGTYIPFFGSPSLGLVHASEQTVHLSVTSEELADEDGELRIPEAEEACEHVPFLLRPLASPPTTARIVVSSQGSERGEMRVDCRTGEVIEGSIKAY